MTGQARSSRFPTPHLISVLLDITLLPAPQELPEVVAVAARREQQLAGFYGRMKEGWGRFLTEDLLRKSDHRTLSSLIRQRAAGVQVTNRSGRVVALGRSRCPMAIWQDGLPVYMPSGSALGGSAAANPPPDLDQWHVSDLQSVEIYNGPSQVPWEFGITGTGCGLILLWTRYR